MKKLSGIFTSTHVDRHGDRMALSALEQARDHIHSQYIPYGIEHDPRIPPIGRVVSAEIKPLDDGEYALEGEVEFYEPGDKISLQEDGREIPIDSYDGDLLYVIYDMGFQTESDNIIISEINNIFGTEPMQEVRKALEPISILTIGGAFVLGQIAVGFLSRLGQDGYEHLKVRLKKLFRGRKKVPDSLLQLSFVLSVDEHEIEVDIIATNPSSHDIDALLDNSLSQLDIFLPQIINPHSKLKKLVFEQKEGKLRLRFGVRKDAVPMFPMFENDNLSVKCFNFCN